MCQNKSDANESSFCLAWKFFYQLQYKVDPELVTLFYPLQTLCNVWWIFRHNILTLVYYSLGQTNIWSRITFGQKICKTMTRWAMLSLTVRLDLTPVSCKSIGIIYFLGKTCIFQSNRLLYILIRLETLKFKNLAVWLLTMYLRVARDHLLSTDQVWELPRKTLRGQHMRPWIEVTISSGFQY